MKVLSRIIDLIYPVVCIECGASLIGPETILCTKCLFKLPVTNFHKDTENEMAKALWGRTEIEFATAYLYFKKGGITQNLLHQLKYKGRKDIGTYLGKRFGQQLKETEFIKTIDYLIPVPLHKSKAKIRGFNQSQLICEGLSEILSIPINNDLERISFTDTQTKKKRFERWLNVSEKFVLRHPENLNGKKVLLVDDVFTTGATIEACCKALTEADGIKIGVATLAFASH